MSHPPAPPPPGPAYRLETPRLTLRPWAPDDAPAMVAAVTESLDHLRPWLLWAQAAPELEDSIARLRSMRASFDRDHDFTYGVFDRAGGHVLGGCGLHARIGSDALEIGYWVHARHAGRGVATELAGALTRAAFAVHRVHRVEIHCDPDNHASARVAAKLGYRHEATLRNRLRRPDGRWRDSMIWTLFAEDLAASPAASLDVAAFDVVGRPMAV